MALNKPSGGRPIGSRNKVSRTVKKTVLDAFLKMQKEKDFNFFEFGKRNPAEFYKICARLIPTEIEASLTDMKDFFKVYKGLDKDKM